MKVYNCIVTENELFSSIFNIEEEGIFYKIVGKTETRSESGQIDIGSNPSAEDGETEDLDPSSVSGINVVLNSRLVETAFSSKKAFQVYLKEHLKLAKEKLQERNPETFDEGGFKARGVEYYKFVCANFSDWQFFVGEDMDTNCAVALVKWDTVDGTDYPILYFFKDSVIGRKV